MALLQARDISVSRHSITLVDKISVSVAAGEVVAIIGPNGAGKTSLIRALTGDLTPDHGEVLLNGRHIDAIPLEEKARQLALLPQHTELNFSFPIADVVNLGRIPHASGKVEDAHIVDEALAAVDMLDKKQRLYTWLSGGEKQRVQLARVMAQLWRAEDSPARLMVFDEPTASLDVAHTRQLMQMTRKLASEGLGLIMVLHDFNLAARYADRILLLKNGSLAVEGPPDRVLTENNMHQFFEVETRVVPHPDNGHPMVFIND